ncbi:MAG: type II toxin-antitoxin system VapC family toxin [Desulfovermiculus sp.]
MHYLLDTNICIYLIKKRPKQVLEQFEKHPPKDVAISSVTLFELAYGAEKSRLKERSTKALQKFLLPLTVVDFDKEAASKAAALRAQLEKKGTPIGAYDLFIAGMALARGMCLVTNNVKEFQRIEELQVENWVE